MKWLVQNFVRIAVAAVATVASSETVRAQGPPNILWQKQENSDRINNVIFSPDGQTLISGSSDRLINFWRTSDGALLRTLNTNATKVHESSVEWLAISSDGTRLASCNYKMVKLWRLPQGSEQQLTGHSDWVVGVAFSPGGGYLASASFDGTVKIWRGSDGGLVKTININSGEVRSVSFSPDGNYLASGGGDGAVRIWRTSDWSLVTSMTGHTSDIYVLSFAPDGATIASGGYDHTVRVWNTSGWTNRFKITASGNVYALAYTKDSQQLAISDGEANHIQLHRVSTGALIKRYDQQVNNVQSIAISQSGLMGYGRADATVVMASLGNTTTTPPPPIQTNPPPTGPNPLTIVWQYTNGALAGWSMNGFSRTESYQINNSRSPGAQWKVLGLGDIDRDGAFDLVWENSAGAAAVWLMNGRSVEQTVPLRDGKPVNSAWRIVGVGDFNGDGNKDVLWRSTGGKLRAWYLNGTEVVQTGFLMDAASIGGWKVSAIGDFDRDGKPDLVLTANGYVQIKLMNGNQIKNTVQLFGGQPQAKGWRIVGAADFDGDGQIDLLVHSTTRHLAVWLMKGTTFSRTVDLNGGLQTTVGWRVAGVTR